MSKDNKLVRVDDRLKRANDTDDDYEYEEVNEERGCAGCAWGMVGVVGCLGVPVGVMIFLLISGTNFIGGIFEGIGNFFNPPPPTYQTVSSNAVLESVRMLSELATVEFNFGQIIVSERELPALLQALYFDKLFYYAVGRIQAGVDFSAIGENDIILEGTTLTLILPPPRLLDCFIDDSASRVVSRDTGVFASPAPNIETEARRIALAHFRDLAIEKDILGDASDKAKETIEQFLSAILRILPDSGVDTIRVIVRDVDYANLVYPSSCPARNSG